MNDMAAANRDPDDRVPVRTPDAPLHVLAHALSLAPLGGVEMCTLQDCLALVARGHRIEMMYGAEGSLRQAYSSAGIRLHGPYEFAFEPGRAAANFRSYRASAQRARSVGGDVLWLNRPEHLIWAQVVARRTGCPVVCHLHERPAFEGVRRLAFRGLALGVAHFVAVSDFVRQAHIERGMPPERITRVYNAVRTSDYPFGGSAERARARSTLKLPSDAPVVLYYGRMITEKGVPALLAAWRAISASRPDAVLVLVDSWSGDRDPAVERQLRQLDPRSYRLFPITADVVPFLHAADVVAFPTLMPEAFGRVVIEGMSTGRPVVASRVGAVPELLFGPTARFLVEPGSVSELTARLSALLDWRETQPGLGHECARWVETRFPYTDHVDALEALLREHRRRRIATGAVPS